MTFFNIFLFTTAEVFASLHLLYSQNSSSYLDSEGGLVCYNPDNDSCHNIGDFGYSTYTYTPTLSGQLKEVRLKSAGMEGQGYYTNVWLALRKNGTLLGEADNSQTFWAGENGVNKIWTFNNNAINFISGESYQFEFRTNRWKTAAWVKADKWGPWHYQNNGSHFWIEIFGEVSNFNPQITLLKQFKSDNVIEISEGGITTESTVVFKATLNNPDNDQIKLQVELKEKNQPFNEQDLLESDFVNSGSDVLFKKDGLDNGQYHWRARTVDDKGNASEWQEFGTPGNVDFEVKLVPLYTQIRSPYPSDEATLDWSDDNYAMGTAGNYECGSKIYQCGCAITSAVMVLRYHNVITAIDEQGVDPKNINNWLNTNQGYDNNGNLKWPKVADYSKGPSDPLKRQRVKYDGVVDFKDTATLDNYVQSLNPVILYHRSFGHFFVGDGKLTTTYTIKDPAHYNTKTLVDTRSGSYIRNYNNHFDGLRLYSPTIAGLDAIYLNLASPAELLITDPLERKLGKDPLNNLTYNEIPNSSYYTEGINNPFSDLPTSPKESKIIWIPEPLDGRYDFQVIGTGEGKYTLSVLVYDQNGESKETIYESDTTISNIQEFELNYSTSTVQQIESYRIVEIDIKPGSYPNSINLKSKGVTPVAVLTNEFFDAKNVVIDSVIFAGVNPSRGNLEDINNDGDLDLILHFGTQSLQLTSFDTEAILTAELNDGNSIKGVDTIKIIDSK